jgi:phage shock protein E
LTPDFLETTENESIMLEWLKKIFGGGADYQKLMDRGAIIVDVRSGPEYDRGHIRGALNIPVDRIGGRVEEFKKKGKPVICCCQSGTRSGLAVMQLKKAGIEAYNGGNWQSLQRKIS